MGSCNSTELEKSDLNIKRQKNSKNVFRSKKLRNLKENLEYKFCKNLSFNTEENRNKQRSNKFSNDKFPDSENNSFILNEISIEIEEYDDSNLTNYSLVNKSLEQTFGDQFLLSDRVSSVKEEPYEVITEISMSVNQAKSPTIQTLNGSNSITIVNNQHKSNAPLSRFGFKPNNASIPITTMNQVQQIIKTNQHVSQVIFNITLNLLLYFIMGKLF